MTFQQTKPIVLARMAKSWDRHVDKVIAGWQGELVRRAVSPMVPMVPIHVQDLPMPSGLVYYLDIKYGPRPE